MDKRLFIGSILMTLVACNSIDEPSVVPDEQIPISFEAAVGNGVRGTITDMSGLRSRGFDVYAIVRNENSYNDGSIYFPPTTYTYSNGTGKWVGQTHFWPDSGKCLDMYFYAPSNAIDSINPTTHEAFFSVSQSVGTQCDLLWAPAIKGLTSATPIVTPHFTHVLSRILITAHIDGTSLTASSGGARINSVTLSGEFNTKGTLNLAAESPATAWKYVEARTTDYSPATTETAITTTDGNEPVNILLDSQEIFIIPTNFTDKECEISVTYTEGGKSYTISHEININFEAGQTYTLNLRLSKPTGTVTPPEIITSPSDPDEDNL